MAKKELVQVTINGRRREASVEPRLLLVHFIRDVLGLTGTHVGCDTTNCGACTVLFAGKPIKSCTVFAVQADEHGLQCGFCTPGMILAAQALLERNPHPTEQEIRWGISGNLCRCTGYQNIVKAVQYAASKMA